MADDSPRSLLRLIRQPDRLSPLSLWKAMPEHDRLSAIGFVLEGENSGFRSYFVEAVARQSNFRERTVASWDNAKLAAAAARIQHRDSDAILGLLQELHRSGRRCMMAAYLDALGVPNDNGFELEEGESETAIEDRVRAAREILHTYPRTDVVIYLLTLHLQGFWHSVPLEYVRQLLDDPTQDSERTADRPIDDAPSLEQESEPDPADVDQFTKLDKLLILATVDVAQGIEGALTVDELDDVIGELIELNSSRHRSFFHAGFLEVLFGRSVREKLPATNDTRAGWYWAGRIQGLARENRWSEIAEHFDSEPFLAALGTTGEGASHAAARFLSEALFRLDRPVDAVAFLSDLAVARDGRLAMLLELEGTRLLDAEDLPAAQAVFDLLGRAVARLESEGTDTSVEPFLRIRRRRAHCYRRLGEFHKARALLDRLLNEDPDPNTVAMVLADIGIIKAGYRGVTAVRLPKKADERASVLAALERGEEMFRLGAEADVRYSAHSKYCLGIMALLRERYGAAADNLESALSVFEVSREHYDRKGFLSTVRMYLALAVCLDLQEDQMAQAIDWIEAAAREGTAAPLYLIEPAVVALGAAAGDYGRRAAEAIIEAAGPEVMDPLVQAGVDSPGVARALMKRASEGRGRTNECAADYRTALPMLLRSRLYDAASEVLDELAQMARGGVGRDEFREILGDPEFYEPAWQQEEALWELTRCLEAEGRYLEAARHLIPEVHRILSEGGFGAPEDAHAVVEHVRSYGSGDGLGELAEEMRGLESRIEAVLETEGSTLSEDSVEDRLPVTIYFVGGDERQAKHAVWIRQRLSDDHSGVTVEFLHPGWSGNWSAELEEAKRVLPRVDGVVVMRFMRTVFGQRLRREIAVPWRGCHGAGRNAMLNSILLTAEMARTHLRNQQGVSV